MNDSLPLIQIPTLEALPAGAARHRSVSLLAVLLVACLAGPRPPRPAPAAPVASGDAVPVPPAPPGSPAKPVPPASPAPPTGGAAEVPRGRGGQGVRPPPAAAGKPLPTIGLDEVK